MFDGRTGKGDAGIVRGCGLARDHQQNLPDEVPDFEKIQDLLQPEDNLYSEWTDFPKQTGRFRRLLCSG